MPVLSRGRGALLTGSSPSGGDPLLVLMAPKAAGSSPPPAECCDLLALSAEGETELTGNITFSAGAGITLTQVGNNIEIGVT